MRKLSNVVIRTLVLSALVVTSAFAGRGSGNIEIEGVGVWEGKNILFFYSQIRSDIPACNTFRKRWVIDLSTELGKFQYSYLLMAEASGKLVEVRGSGSCSFWSDSETVLKVGGALDYSKYPN